MVWRCLFSVNIITKKYEKNSSYNVIKNELWAKTGCLVKIFVAAKGEKMGLRWRGSPRI